MKKSNFFISIVLFLCFQTVIGQTVPRELTPGQTWEDPDDTWGGTGGNWGGTGTTYTWFMDSDGDTLGDPGVTTTSITPSAPLGYVNNSNDCDDNNICIMSIEKIERLLNDSNEAFGHGLCLAYSLLNDLN